MKTQNTVKPEWRPFHETIVVALSQEGNPAVLGTILALLNVTKIPAGHDMIVQALDLAFSGQQGGTVWLPMYRETRRNVLRQKKAEQAKQAEKHEKLKRGIVTTALEFELAKSARILKNRTPDSHWENIASQLGKTYNALGIALGKNGSN